MASPALDPDVQAFRMPAEWEEHEATWLGWPHNLSDWPGRFAPIPWVYGDIVRKLAEGEIVRILVPSKVHEAKARRVLERVGAATGARRVLPLADRPRLDARLRAPLRAARAPRARGGGRALPLHRLGQATRTTARTTSSPSARRRPSTCSCAGPSTRGGPVVLEGGAIDVNGKGTILTTEECLLDPFVQVRNPGFKRADYEQVFLENLGATHTVWLGKGIAGDDTHGHVDDLCRFVNETTIVLCREKDPKDANYRALEENRERLQDARLADGSKPEVVELPMPAPLVFDGRRLPASYANFYVANAAVLVPTFNDPNDRLALGILAEQFKGRPVVGIHAVDLVWGLGTLHCLTQQQPKA